MSLCLAAALTAAVGITRRDNSCKASASRRRAGYKVRARTVDFDMFDFLGEAEKALARVEQLRDDHAAAKAKVSRHGLQLQSLLRIPTAAVGSTS